MNEFNHLKNLCEFLDDIDNFNACFVDDGAQYDEAAARELFSEHIYNLLLQADVEEQMASSMSDALTATFYRVPHEYYKESTMLQSMLRAADVAAEKQLKRLEAGDFNFDKFNITVDDYSAAFLLGGPQLDALYKFAHHIAYENGYEIKEIDGLTTVEE